MCRERQGQSAAERDDNRVREREWAAETCVSVSHEPKHSTRHSLTTPPLPAISCPVCLFPLFVCCNGRTLQYTPNPTFRHHRPFFPFLPLLCPLCTLSTLRARPFSAHFFARCHCQGCARKLPERGCVVWANSGGAGWGLVVWGLISDFPVTVRRPQGQGDFLSLWRLLKLCQACRCCQRMERNYGFLLKMARK